MRFTICFRFNEFTTVNNNNKTTQKNSNNQIKKQHFCEVSFDYTTIQIRRLWLNSKRKFLWSYFKIFVLFYFITYKVRRSNQIFLFFKFKNWIFKNIYFFYSLLKEENWLFGKKEKLQKLTRFVFKFFVTYNRRLQ